MIWVLVILKIFFASLHKTHELLAAAGISAAASVTAVPWNHCCCWLSDITAVAGVTALARVTSLLASLRLLASLLLPRHTCRRLLLRLIFSDFSHRLIMELDLQSLFGLHVHCAVCTAVLVGRDPPPLPCSGAHVRGRYWSAKIDDISVESLIFPTQFQ